MITPRLDRRKFSTLCAALGAAWPTRAAMTMLPVASALAVETGAAARTVTLPGGAVVPAVGQGTSRLGQGRRPAAEEQEALRLGLSLGLHVIDTAENYGDGRSETSIGQAIAGARERAFVVSKLENDHVNGDAMVRACDASLARLGTDHLDLYLLHWPVPDAQFAGLVAGFERLRAAGKIRAWGVSNFDARQMEALFGVPDGGRCAVNQVPYSLADRGIERDLLPWCRRHDVPVMAYSPLGGTGSHLVRDPTLARIGAAHGGTAAAVALAWLVRRGDVIAIPESAVAAHVRENAAALTLALTSQNLQSLEAAYPGPVGAN